MGRWTSEPSANQCLSRHLATSLVYDSAIMKPRTFSELFQEAEQHEDYWVAGAILEFTENLVREMDRQGITRTELARRLGATPAYVTKILRGKVNFTLATMVRLARALEGELHVQLTGPAQAAAKRAHAR